jgi:hypothetical protein
VAQELHKTFGRALRVFLAITPVLARAFMIPDRYSSFPGKAQERMVHEMLINNSRRPSLTIFAESRQGLNVGGLIPLSRSKVPTFNQVDKLRIAHTETIEDK